MRRAKATEARSCLRGVAEGLLCVILGLGGLLDVRLLLLTLLREGGTHALREARTRASEREARERREREREGAQEERERGRARGERERVEERAEQREPTGGGGVPSSSVATLLARGGTANLCQIVPTRKPPGLFVHLSQRSGQSLVAMNQESQSMIGPCA